VGSSSTNCSATLRERSALGAELDPLTDARWADFVARAPGAGPFHHPAWLEIIQTHYGWPVRACCLLGDDGAVLAGLPVALVSSRLTGRRLVALPFSDACAPLAPEGKEDELARALDAYRRRTGLPLFVHGSVPGGSVTARYHAHRLTLDGGHAEVQELYAKPQVMRGVRRAQREGLVAERRTDAEALAVFYRLHAATRRRLGAPTQPRRFILRFADLFDRGLGFVVLVRDAGRAVAGAVFLTWNGTLVYKYGASDAHALPKRPNNLVIHEAIRLAHEDGMRVVDFGRTDLGHESLRSFKLGFGAEESELSYTCLADRPPAPGGRDLHALAAPVLRRCPPLVSRLVGELLYRHAGT
jgi:CelD/BcsL family acetyltransferase involved in cellulose biosynthesis